MGPNVSKDKAGELEEEESAGTALMPQPMKAGSIWAVSEAVRGCRWPAAFGPFRRPQMFKKPTARE